MNKAKIEQHFPNAKVALVDQVNIVVYPNEVLDTAITLRDHQDFQMDVLLDLCVVDYLHYGLSEWDIENATDQGYGRAQVAPMSESAVWDGPRFVVVCHLLSLSQGTRIRLKINIDETMRMPSLTEVWPSANWYEREGYDLFGVVFDGHPDLRRILTDYGFVGFPFRKDFPLIGTQEMRYDGALEKCIYEPVSIENRVGVPKVIRDDHRYIKDDITCVERAIIR